MNRIIKFRAWDKNHKKMLYVGDNVLTSTLGKMIDLWTSTLGKMIDFFEDEDLMQSTGLFDKNGKEIYEGDIVHQYNQHKDFGLFVVKKINGLGWNYNGFELVNKVIKRSTNFSPDSIWWESDNPSNWDEVIGNIYENPELLN